MKTEIDQLLVVAKHELSMAKRIARRNRSMLSVKITDVTDGHIPGQLLQEELTLAHLANCAIRLCTVCEIRKDKFKPKDNCRNKFYRSDSYPRYSRKEGYSQDAIIKEIMQNLDEHIHFLLRDNVAHKQSAKSDIAVDRRKILDRLSVGVSLSAINSCIEKIVKRIG